MSEAEQGHSVQRVLVTGAADGLGHAAALRVLDAGLIPVVHVRNEGRVEAVGDLVGRGAEVVTGDLAVLEQVRGLAEQLDQLAPVDAVIHNAGVISGAAILPVNVVTPYVLTALLPGVHRHIYLSSSMHRGGHATVTDLDWSGGRETATYSDSKLLLTAFMAAVARLRPNALINAVDPGWVPTKMGGAGATDDLELGHLTQFWLAVSDDDEARTTGGYWHHQRREHPHPAVEDISFQDELVTALAQHTGLHMN